MTGVMEMQTLGPRDGGPRAQVGVSLTNARLLGRGRFARGRGDWLISARHGYLDLVMEMVGVTRRYGDELVPRYGDVMGKAALELGRANRVSIHTLYAADQLRARDGDLRAATSYGNRYLWARWESHPAPGLSAQTVASVASLEWDRRGEWSGERAGTRVADRRELGRLGVRQDLSWDASRHVVARAGWEWAALDARYTYRSHRQTLAEGDGTGPPHLDSIHVDARPAGSVLAGYLAARVRPAEPLVLEAGMRYDAQRYSGDQGWSPRLNLRYRAGPATTLRAAWGVYRQAQPIHSLQVQDGVRTFSPAERAEHRVLGVEHTLRGAAVRVEAYQRLLPSVRPRFVNLDRSLDIFPEVEEDRFLLAPDGGESRGVEVFAQGGEGQALRWHAAYTLARIIDRYGPREIPRDTDQRHTLQLGAAYLPNPAWRLSAAWRAQSGLPITPREFRIVALPDGGARRFSEPGALYSERLGSYQRLDVRLTRSWTTRRGRGSAFLDVFNALDRANPRGYDYGFSSAPDGTPRVNRTVSTSLPLIPSIGFTWEF
ncbi:MAG: TonB-dependent receptor [Gemmatimonadetes bacterium]|nr:TonB-dependent receptor [Gemmatimonadota bacterium]